MLILILNHRQLMINHLINDRKDMVKRFIVIGNPIKHSKSPQIHQVFAQQVDMKIAYHRQFCPNDKEAFMAVVDAFFHGGGNGANVTVPFKQTAYEMCRQLGGVTEHAHVAGAVNTLYQQADILLGDNTDGQGLVNHLMSLGWSLDGIKVAIIGAGGATRGVLLPLLEAGVRHITIANRTVAKAEQLITDFLIQGQTLIENRHREDLQALFDSSRLDFCAISELEGQFDLVINATSIGLTDEQLPLSSGLKTGKAYDMMYGKPLMFLHHFAQQGAETSDGFGMLIHQAALSFQIWTNKTLDMATLESELLSSLS